MALQNVELNWVKCFLTLKVGRQNTLWLQCYKIWCVGAYLLSGHLTSLISDHYSCHQTRLSEVLIHVNMTASGMAVFRSSKMAPGFSLSPSPPLCFPLHWCHSQADSFTVVLSSSPGLKTLHLQVKQKDFFFLRVSTESQISVSLA